MFFQCRTAQTAYENGQDVGKRENHEDMDNNGAAGDVVGGCDKW